MAVPVIESVSSHDLAAAGTTLTVNTPSGAASGDLLVFALALSGGSAGMSLSGWTAATSSPVAESSGLVGMAVWYLHLTGAPAASYSPTWTTSRLGCGVMLRISGHDTSDPEDVTAPATSNVNVSPFDCASVTTLGADRRILYIASCNRRTIDSGPAAASLAVEVDAGAQADTNDASLSVYSKSQASAGASGTGTFGASSTCRWSCLTMAISGASGGGGGGNRRRRVLMAAR